MKLITAPIERPICLFMVGIQCRSWRSLWKGRRVMKKMGLMQEELKSDPDSGLIWGTNFISFSPFTTLFLSYWESSEYIHRFISDDRFSHLGASKDYWKRFGQDPNIGVWHETYEIEPKKTENLYFGMLPFGASAFNTTQGVVKESGKYMSRLRREEL